VIHLHLTVPVVADPPSSKVPVPTHHRQYHRPFIDSATPRKSSITGLSSLTGHVHVVDTVRTPSKYLQSLFSSTLVNYSPPIHPFRRLLATAAFPHDPPFFTITAQRTLHRIFLFSIARLLISRRRKLLYLGYFFRNPICTVSRAGSLRLEERHLVYDDTISRPTFLLNLPRIGLNCRFENDLINSWSSKTLPTWRTMEQVRRACAI
jgi:hypothetical protein